MKSINWTRLPDEGELPAMDPERERTKERPAVTLEAAKRSAVRDSATDRVLRSMARRYAGYNGLRS